MKTPDIIDPDQPNFASTRRGWLKTVGLGGMSAGALALAGGCATSATTETAAAAAMPTDHLPDLTAPTDGLVRLSSNENPFGPSPKAVEAMSKYLEYTARYADKETAILAEQIAEIEGVSADQVVISNGSSRYGRTVGSVLLSN